MIAPDLEAIPSFLTDIPRWLAWRNESRKGKLTKAPKTGPNTAASSTNPSTWASFADVAAVLQRQPKLFDGCGIVLGNLDNGEHLCGVDLDACLDDDGAPAEWAKSFIAVLLTYGEISPSERGLKFVFRCPADVAQRVRAAFGFVGDAWGCKRSVGANGADHGPGVEVYIGPGRYFTITGRQWPQASDDVALFDHSALLRLAALTPKPATNGAGTDGPGRDTSRSAAAYRLGAALRRAGKTFEQMCDALRADPETAEWCREKGDANDARELRRIWEKARTKSKPRAKPTQEADDDLITEGAVADAFADEHRDRLRFDHDCGAWFIYDGVLWRRERTKLAYRWAHQRAKALAADTDNAKAIISAGRASFAAGVERLAQSDRAFAVTGEIWDADPMLLGTPNGTVDLRTGYTRPPAREDYISKSTAVAPADTADCPLWLKFLNQACSGDAGLIGFLQQWCGYSLTGSIEEHALLFAHGPGGNGKSVWLNTVANIMGDYCRTAAMDTFTASKHDRHPTELAALKGARVVCASETEEGRAWSEVRIKQLTGGDRIAARFMHRDFFEYTPQFKLTVIGNHVPDLHNVDDAARRRFNLAPFTHKPAVVDRKLEAKLRAEWPGILRWMIIGCLDWRVNGLIRPDAVNTSTADYFSDQDLMAQWIEDCCERTNEDGIPAVDTIASLLASWRNYAKSRGEEPGSSKGFSMALRSRGFARIRDEAGIRGRGFRGLRVRVQRYEPAGAAGAGP